MRLPRHDSTRFLFWNLQTKQLTWRVLPGHSRPLTGVRSVACSPCAPCLRVGVTVPYRIAVLSCPGGRNRC
eukprot:6790519-Prymnesium_polylepis.1